jgi:methylthioribose-1-phosphate isomerase
MTLAGPRPATVPSAVRFADGVLYALDQAALPWSERELALRDAEQVAIAIERLQIRGAPLIGVAAAYGLALALAADPGERALLAAHERLRATRPTAVNLTHALERVRAAALEAAEPRRAAAALAQARAIEAEERAASASIAAHGARLLAGARRLLTHCNTGFLAAPGRGTALAVIAEKADREQLELVLATETRPLLQGARLTVYELSRLGIEHRLIADSAAAGLIASGAVDAAIVGCDRVALNGDVANKVGTYAIALAAHAAKIPLVVAGPTSTIDPRIESGEEITIEERGEDEVRRLRGVELTLPGTPCRNPAFDVTPAALVSALVTERGVAEPPNAATISALLHR